MLLHNGAIKWEKKKKNIKWAETLPRVVFYQSPTSSDRPSPIQRLRSIRRCINRPANPRSPPLPPSSSSSPPFPYPPLPLPPYLSPPPAPSPGEFAARTRNFAWRKEPFLYPFLRIRDPLLICSPVPFSSI